MQRLAHRLRRLHRSKLAEGPRPCVKEGDVIFGPAFDAAANSYYLTWTPTFDDIGKTYVVLFDMQGEVFVGRTVEYNLTALLGLTVSGYVHDFTVRPGDDRSPGATYQFYQDIPLTAEIRDTRLVNLATGAEPSAVPFPDHEFVILHEGTMGFCRPDLDHGPCSYGITFRVRNTEGTVISAPNQTWQYTVDHTPGFWQGRFD